jgi:MoxR-like ATPase
MATKAISKPELVLPEGYTWPELHRLVGTTLGAGISVLVRGHPGVGKSTLAARLAADAKLPLVDIRLAQRDPADLCGVWFPDPATQSLRAFPPEWAVLASRQPVFVFLDEINAAVTKLHQAAAYQIVLERRVGEVRFHPDTVVMAAGNLEEDNALVTPLSSALCNRFAHYILRADATTWLDWASQHGVDEAILGYVSRFREEVLYVPDLDGMAFPTPRSWEMASRVFQRGEETDRKRLVSACIGVGAADKLFSWLKIYRQIDAAKIITKGQLVDFTTKSHADPSFTYAATFAVAAWLKHPDNTKHLTDAQLENIVHFLRSPGLDLEYSFLCVRHFWKNTELVERLRKRPTFREFAGELVNVTAATYA